MLGARRLHAVIAVLGMLSAGCGSLLTQEERTALAEARKRRPAADVPAAGAASSEELTRAPEEIGGSAGSVPGGGGAGAAAEAGGGDAVSAVGSCPRATEATDIGVTPGTIRIATLADISGVQPGLFQSSHEAARAATLFINSQGGICGRQVELLALDSKTDSGGNRAAMLDACARAFAVVGSMSAFDDGSAPPGRDCGIPDMTSITTHEAKYNAPNVFPIMPNAGPALATTPAEYIAKRFPDVIKRSAILYLNQAVTRNNAVARKVAWESVGFRFIYEAEVQVLEANYTRFVQEMRDRGVQYVNMVSDYQSIVRLQKSMRQQGYTPKVRGWDSVAYDRGYLNEPEPVEGSFVFLNTAMIEEAGSNPEMKQYTEWLQRAAPGATPTYFGIYTWSAFRLFQKLATEIGPDLTRPKLLAALRATEEWGGNGIHAPHRIGDKVPSPCNLNVEVKGGEFTRMSPASGFDCNGGLYRR